MKKKEKNSYGQTLRLTVSAILSGLSFAVLYLGCVTGVFDLCAVVVGALCCAFAVIELSGVWPWLMCAVTTVLSVILLPDKMVAFEYLFLGGLYPILKYHFENRKSRVVEYILKLAYFNLALTVTLLVARFVFPADEAWQIFGVLAYIIGNLFFVFYDYAMTNFISFYLLKLRGKLRIRKLFQ